MSKGTKWCLISSPKNMDSRRFSQVTKTQNNSQIFCDNSILGESFKSHKMWKMLRGFKGAAYLTILTREFLLEDLLSKEGKRRIDDNPVNSKTYNVFVFRPVLTTSHTHLYLEIMIYR